MALITFLVGQSVDSRQDLLTGKMASCSYDSILHLVPTNGGVMELETNSRFWLKRRAVTLTGLIHQIFEENIRFEKYPDSYLLDDDLRSLLIKKIMDRRRMQPDGLSFFYRYFQGRDTDDTPPGIYKAIARFFSKLIKNNYQDRLAPDLAGRMIRLEEQAPGLGEERYALESDLTWLFGDYEEIKREVNAYDRDDVLACVRYFLLEGGIPEVTVNTDVLIFDGFTHLTRAEEDILFHLFKKVDEVWWLLDYYSQIEDPLSEFKKSSGLEAVNRRDATGASGISQTGRDESYRIFSPMVSLIERVEDAEFDIQVERATERDLPNPIAGNIYFHRETGGLWNNSLKIKSFSNKEDEVRAIAGEIKKIIFEDNLSQSCDLGKIRIIFPDLNDYSSLISEIFSEYGIPFSLTRGLPLISHPISNIICYIFEVPLNGFRRDDIFCLFSSELIHKGLSVSSGYGSDLPEILKEFVLGDDNSADLGSIITTLQDGGLYQAPDVRLFDRVARICGLDNLDNLFLKGRDSCIPRVREFYQDKCSNAGKDNEKFRLEYYRFLMQIKLFEGKLEQFRRLADRNDPLEIEELLLIILRNLGFPENIMDMHRDLDNLDPNTERGMGKRGIKAYSLLMDLIHATQKELHITQGLFKIKGGHNLLSRFYAIFRSRLNSAYLFDERNPNVVRVSQWLEIRGRAFDYIFVGGLIADRFPLQEERDFILPEFPNSAFRISDPVDQSRHLFAHVLKNYRKRLYISYPRYTSEKEASPSQMLTDLESVSEELVISKNKSGIMEDLFRWEYNPYFTSKEEMLNVFVTKAKNVKGDDSSFLKRIIFNPNFAVEDLLRGIRALESRNASDGLYEYDGIVTESIKFKEFYNESKRIFSPSQLDTLANCPMRYLFEEIFDLGAEERAGLEISPRDMGEHLHKILSIFFKRLRSENKKISDIGLQDAFCLARESAEEYYSMHPFLERIEFFPYQKMEFLEGLDKDPGGSGEMIHGREGAFAQLIRFEAIELVERRPAGIEYYFGSNEQSSIMMGGIRIKGFIDRFDIDEIDKEQAFIYDYKSGKIPPLSMVKKGLSFQLPSYLNALRSGLGFKAISASFYSLKREDLLTGDPLKEFLLDHSWGAKGLDISGVRLIDDYVDALTTLLEKGYFHHSADEIKCSSCDFRYACYKETRRMNHLLDTGIDQFIYSGKKNLKRWKEVDILKKELKSVFKSMEKAFDLKTESGRKKHYDLVMNFRGYLIRDRDKLPFHLEYIDEIIDEIGAFQRRYNNAF